MKSIQKIIFLFFLPLFFSANAKIIPTDKDGNTVSYYDTNLESKFFDIKSGRNPRIVLRDSSNQEVDLKKGKSALVGLRVLAEDGENTDFIIRKMTIILARGGKTVYEETVTSGKFDFSTLSARGGSGDRIIIEVQTVVRMTPQGTEEVVPISGKNMFTIPL